MEVKTVIAAIWLVFAVICRNNPDQRNLGIICSAIWAAAAA